MNQKRPDGAGLGHGRVETSVDAFLCGIVKWNNNMGVKVVRGNNVELKK